MQSKYETGCDELTDDSGATDSCAHCAAEDKLQQAIYYCFKCGPFGRYMCESCNKQHKKFAYMHEVRGVSAAAQLTRETQERGCFDIKDESGATDICAHCASDYNIRPAVCFCFQCGRFGRYMCGICNKLHKKFANAHSVSCLPNASQALPQPSKIYVHSSREVDNDYEVVAAIDIGTTFSGYAFSKKDDFERDPLKISSNTWNAGWYMGLKTLTCVLFDKNKKFHSFGFDAEDNYCMWSEDKYEDCYFFRRIKMTICDENLLCGKLMLEDELGKKMDALDVFSASIKFLRDHLIETLHKSLPDTLDSNIRWVLTVPAIWNDASKQFITKAAQKAGINDKQLRIALEPEAASMLYRYLPTNLDDGVKPFEPKSKYLILDAGGNAINITLYAVKDDGAVKELYKAHEVKWGGTYIDKAFRDLLAAIVGHRFMANFQATKMMDYIDLFRMFEIKKRNITNRNTATINFRVPISLWEDFAVAREITIKDHLKTKPEYNDKVIWVGDKLRIEHNIATDLFKETCDNVVTHLKSLFNKPEVKDVPTIFMVGGFSECSMLQDAIKKTFPNKRIFIPNDAGLAVLKGAVILGHTWGCRSEHGII